MEKFNILFDKKSPQKPNSEIVIALDNDNLIDYKVLVGFDGIWNTIKDFETGDKCVWKPKEKGSYIVMIQGKKRNSSKPYDFVLREDFEIGNTDKEILLEDVIINKDEFTEGERVKIEVKIKNIKTLYRFYRKRRGNWQLLKDYSKENIFEYAAIEPLEEEILIEAKKIDSREAFDDFTTIKFKVNAKGKLEIRDFRSLNEDLILDDELVFKVDATGDENHSLLYKFIKIDCHGKKVCLQDYSSRRIVAYKENEPGEYRILCLMKDVLSRKPFDDRALIVYNVLPYREIKINKVVVDVKSPQREGTDINVKVDAEGGDELVYRFVVEGAIVDDSCYTRNKEFTWTPKKAGSYKIKVFVKDAKFKGEYEALEIVNFDIDKKSERPIRIVDIISNENKEMVINKPINLRIITEGGTTVKFMFTIYKDGKEIDKTGFSQSNWINYTPKTKGDYRINVKVKDRYSEEPYEVEENFNISVMDFVRGTIEHILMPNKAIYLVGDFIDIEAITKDTRNTQINFITNINGRVVEETGFITNKKFCINPKCAGKYTFEIYAKNVKSDKEYDTRREASIFVQEAIPITNTTLIYDKTSLKINNEITFAAECFGGKDIVYEFYLMENGNWIKAQNYSKKKYYTFIPYCKGDYRILVLAKSFNKRVSYEDYYETIFTVR